MRNKALEAIYMLLAGVAGILVGCALLVVFKQPVAVQSVAATYTVVQTEAAQTEVTQGTGLVCDTAEQVEQWVTLHNTGMKNADVFVTINKDKDVCMILSAAFYKGEAVKRVMADGLVYEITPILVVGIAVGGAWVQVSPNQIFSIFKSKDKGA